MEWDMSPEKTLRLPRFGSQQSSTKRDKRRSSRNQSDPSSWCPQVGKHPSKKGKKNEKLKLKVKLATRGLSQRKASRMDKTPGRLTPEPAETMTGTQGTPGGQSREASGGDVFFFSQTSTDEASPPKKKGWDSNPAQTKLAVLRTITSMVEENQLIRKRLVALSQAH